MDEETSILNIIYGVSGLLCDENEIISTTNKVYYFHQKAPFQVEILFSNINLPNKNICFLNELAS